MSKIFTFYSPKYFLRIFDNIYDDEVVLGPGASHKIKIEFSSRTTGAFSIFFILLFDDDKYLKW